MWGIPSKPSERDHITESLRALKTLRCEHGRVSVDPLEVIDRPGYREARAAAARLIYDFSCKRQRNESEPLGLEALTRIVAKQLMDVMRDDPFVEEAKVSVRACFDPGAAASEESRDQGK